MTHEEKKREIELNYESSILEINRKYKRGMMMYAGCLISMALLTVLGVMLWSW